VISVKKKKGMAGTCYISVEWNHNETYITPAKEQDLSNYKTNDMVNGGGPLQI